MASIVFVTTACWRTAIAPSSSRSAEACWPCALRGWIATTIVTKTQVAPTTKRPRTLAAAAAWQLLKSLRDHSIGRTRCGGSTACARNVGVTARPHNTDTPNPPSARPRVRTVRSAIHRGIFALLIRQSGQRGSAACRKTGQGWPYPPSPQSVRFAFAKTAATLSP
jgi:hypothetical protein